MNYDGNKYSVYFEIDEGYYPEINESSIKDPKNRWQDTFPHKSIVALLKTAERVLSRNDKKSLWIDGAYGTGKSRIIWMMQNLLSCNDADFNAYFDEYENLKREIDLRGRLKAIRDGKVVTAYRYATGDITSTQKLIFAVFESLTSALKKRNCKYDGDKTLRGKIVHWLEIDPANFEMFRAKIRKPEYKMYPTLSHRSAEEIIERLKNPNAEVSQLVEDILKLGDREGIRAFNIDMNGLKDWISEVIADNNLKALVLFWDEFSKFFGNNRNNLDEFQNLAELSNIVPFYLVIATHEIDAFANIGDKSFKIVKDRFITQTITMPDHIAFELIGHALKVNKHAQNEWKNLTATLRSRTEEPRKAVMKFAKISDDKLLTNILPIHPMAAILLKNISTYFASNQRSMFNFIKNSNPNVQAFQEFINTKYPLNGDLLTIDYLWNFFYESGTDERGGSVGRMNLDQTVRAILDSYIINKTLLTPEEDAVLKTILLFQAISYRGREDVEIFLPSEKNLELAFIGVGDMENGRTTAVADELVRKGILYKRPGKVPTYAAMSLAGDQATIEQYKLEIIKNVNTAKLVEDANLLDVISLVNSQKFRYELRAVTADNFTAVINRITNDQQTYKIMVIVSFARNEDEQNKLHNLISGAIVNSRYHRLVFVDASSNFINSEVFNRWVENSANEKYWRGKDNALAEQIKTQADACLKEWRTSLENNGYFVCYPATKLDDEVRKGTSCQSVSQITDALKDNVERLYRYTFDNENITGTLFSISNLQRLAEAGIKQETYSMLTTQQARILLGGCWQFNGDYWKEFPQENFSRLKQAVDELIKNELDKNIRISFDDITNFLLECGFMPLNVYAFLTGFLLKEYATDRYRYSAGVDGMEGGELSAKKLAECIAESFKKVTTPIRVRPKYIEKMSKNQQRFMYFASMIFGVDENVSVEHSAQKLRDKLKTLHYPFWCYSYASEEKYKNFLQLIAGIANTKQTVSVSHLAEKAGEFLIENPIAFDDLKNFLTVSKGREIFTNFLQDFDGGIIFELAEKIGVDNVVAECQRLVTVGDAIWLHDKEASEVTLKNLIVDYKIVAESRKFGIIGNSLNACITEWQNFCKFNIKIPADIIGKRYPTVKNFFADLKEIVQRGEIPQGRRDIFLSQLIDNAEIIKSAISNLQEILQTEWSAILSGFNNEEISDIFTKLPQTSFTDKNGIFIQKLTSLAEGVKKDRIRQQMLNLWHEVAGKESPRDWSNNHRTPILVMVPDNEQSTARKVFDTINANAPDENDIRFAIEYLKQRPAYFKFLNDAERIEESFRKVMLGDNSVLFDDNNEIRDALKLNDVYQWYPNPNVVNIIKQLAARKYYNGGVYDKLNSRIEKMSDKAAKKLLLELLDKNYEIGLKLLNERV